MKAQLKEFEGFRSGYKNQTGARTWVNTWAMDIWPKELESNHDLTGNMFPPFFGKDNPDRRAVV